MDLGGVTRQMAVGTYFWRGPSGNTWWDPWCAVTPAEPVPVHSPFVGRFRLLPGAPPTDVRMRVFPVLDAEGSAVVNGLRCWQWPEQEEPVYELPLVREQDVQLVRRPGLYVVEIWVWWQDTYGDVAYGLLVEVQP